MTEYFFLLPRIICKRMETTKGFSYCFLDTYGVAGLCYILGYNDKICGTPYNYTASLCYLLDIRGSQTLESILERYSFYATGVTDYVCVMFSVFFDADGYERGPTSRHSVRPEIQKYCNFEAHAYV